MKKRKAGKINIVRAAIKGIQEKKGEQIICLNLKKIKNRVCDYFIICEANSTTQASAIARSVEHEIKKETGESPYHSEGFANSEWILIDYVGTVIHIFQHHVRHFYRLENLWADAEVKKY